MIPALATFLSFANSASSEQGSWYIGRAIVLPSPSAMRAVEVMAETLKSNVAGGAFFHKDFTTIVYPSASEAWRFIEEDFPSDLPPAQLHCVVCRPFIGSLLQNTNRSVNAQMILTMEGEKGVNVFFREQFGIDYAKLVPGSANRKNDQPNNFFLMYPQSASEEHEVVVNFLRANNTTIFSSYTAGSWEYFCTCINGGVLLVSSPVVLFSSSSNSPSKIHPSFQNLHLIPYLSRLITRKTLNIFSITLSPPPEEPNLIRLFPHGGVILITDSLILLHPSLAVRILKWFRLFILTTKPSWTWKIALRPHFRSWILDIVEERSAESLDSGKIFTAIYEQIYYLLPLEMMEDWDDYETPKDEAAAVSASDLSRFDKGVGLDPKRHDLEALAKNDARLVEWFAGWARTKVEDHRKFHAVCPEIEEEGEISGEEARKEWGKKWNHVSELSYSLLFSFFSDFFQIFRLFHARSAASSPSISSSSSSSSSPPPSSYSTSKSFHPKQNLHESTKTLSTPPPPPYPLPSKCCLSIYLPALPPPSPKSYPANPPPLFPFSKSKSRSTSSPPTNCSKRTRSPRGKPNMPRK